MTGIRIGELPLGVSDDNSNLVFEGEDGRARRERKSDFERSAVTQSKDYTDSILQGLSAGAPMFPTIEAGLSGTEEGEFFNVPGDQNDVLQILYRHDPGPIATELGRSLSEGAVAKIRDYLMQGGSADYSGDGPIWPIITDSQGRAVLWFNSDTFEIGGAGIASAGMISQVVESIVRQFLAQRGSADYVGQGDVWPILSDATGRVLLGYDVEQGAIIGAGIASATANGGLEFPPIEAGLNHFIFYGQSLSVGSNGKPVLSVSQPYNNVTFDGGPRAFDGTEFAFAPIKPLVEDDNVAPDGGETKGETPCSGMANYSTTLRAMDGHQPNSHVILASAAGQGGRTIAELSKGAAWYGDVFMRHVSEAHAIDDDHAVQAVGWLQGERDGVEETSRAAYVSALNKLISDVNIDARAITDQASPVYFLIYQTATRSASYGEIQKAQLDVVRDNPLAFLATPIYHMPTYSDGIHLTNVGYKWTGAYFGRAYKQLIDGRPPESLMPISATLRGQTLAVRFRVPTAPMVLDTDDLAPTQDYGFRVTDENGTVSISDISISGDEVTIVLDSVPAGDVGVRYALDYLGTGLITELGASGNLRDSSPETIEISGIQRPLWHVAPHFELPVTRLGE